MLDRNFSKIVSAVFMNIFQGINSPRYLTSAGISNQIKWLEELIVWAHEERYWFACWEEMGYNVQRLRDRISRLASERLEGLKEVRRGYHPRGLIHPIQADKD